MGVEMKDEVDELVELRFELSTIVAQLMRLERRFERVISPKKRRTPQPKKEEKSNAAARIIAHLKTHPRPGGHSKKELCEALKLSAGEAAGALRRSKLAGHLVSFNDEGHTFWGLPPESLPLPFQKADTNGLKLAWSEPTANALAERT